MSKATLAHAPTLSDEQIDQILDTTADSFATQLRSPIMHAPSEQNLVYEEVTFPGAGNDPTTHVGPVVTKAQQSKVLEYIAVGKQALGLWPKADCRRTQRWPAGSLCLRRFWPMCRPTRVSPKTRSLDRW